MAAKGKSGKGSELRAGLVVLVGLAILGIGLFLVSGGADQFRDKNLYTVHFTNSGGIGSGDAVYLAGERVGKVNSVDTVEVVADGVTRRYKEVVIELIKSARVQVDSPFSVSKTVTGIVAMNGEYGIGRDADEKTILKGERLSTFEEAIDLASKTLESAQGLVDQVKEVVRKVDERVAAIDTAILQAKAEALLDSLGRSGAKVETILGDAEEPIARTLERAENAAAHAESLLADLKASWGKIDPKLQASLDDLRATLGEAKAMIEENRPTVKSALEALRDGVERIGPALDTIDRTMKGAHVMVIEVRPQLVGALKAARGAFENFEAVTEDLKSAPWKLINKPSGAEDREVHLYNAARLHVTNATKIHAIVEELATLRELAASGDDVPVERVQEALTRLEEALVRHRASEKALADLIAGSGAK
ncbi:MAG: hypothetical protein HC813_03490 [Planctomycetes bacterium]|nr:hypothetical protein [Planctomycetota bacterium]